MTTHVSGGGGGGIDGLTTDGNKGIIVAGAITAGDPVHGSLFSLTGGQIIQDVPNFGSPLLELDQTATATLPFGNASIIRVVRGDQPTFHTSNPIINVENDDFFSTADTLAYLGPRSGQAFKVGVHSGIGTHDHTSQAAARTLAQATITAITDANAQAAVQACANALVDIGALTLT